MEDTTSESTDGGNPGRRIVIIRVPASDIFLKSDCRSVCARNLFRGEAGCCTCDDRRCLTWYYNEFVVYDRDGIDRIAPFDAFRIGGIKEGAGNVYAGCMWRDDRLYLFGNHGYCCDLCR